MACSGAGCDLNFTLPAGNYRFTLFDHGRQVSVSNSNTLRVENPKLWSLENPHLYDLRAEMPEAEEPELGGTLLGYGAGRWTLAPPIPAPTMLPRDDVNGRTEWRPGLTLSLFRAKF